MDIGFRFLAIALALATGTARADSADLEWLGIAYVWAADVEIDVRDATLGIPFSDTVGNLEMGFQGHVEAQGDDFGGFVDVSFMAVGTHHDIRQGVRVSTDLDMTSMDLALVWSPAADAFTDIEVFGGLRYIDTDLSVVVEDPPFPVTGVDSTYYDVLLGARYAAPINEQWRLVFSADLSGGDTEGTWSVGGYGVYRMGRHRFYGGYRYLEIDLKARGGDSFTETFSGPAIAYGFSF